MHQTKKGNQWYFGMKAHIGTDRAGQPAVAEAASANDHGLIATSFVQILNSVHSAAQ